MRKQTKLVAVASAAALLAIGASMTSFAATGWVEEDGQWYFYDKDGNRVEDEWKKSGDNWYWLDSEEGGAMAVDKLIEDDEDYYYVDGNGVMVTNTWVKVVNEDQDDDDDPAEYRYYYMQSNGKAYRQTGSSSNLSKKTIDGKRYAFDDEGRMLYGWVTADGTMVNDDDGWNTSDVLYYFGGWEDGSMKTGWQKITVHDNEDGKDDDYDYWFNFKSNGERRAHANADDTWKSNSRYYHFDERGVMVYQWFETATTNSASASNWAYFSSPEDGARVTKGWFKVVAPTEDNSFLESDATFATKDSNDESERWYYSDSKDDGLVVGEIKKIKGKYYGFWPDDGVKGGRMLIGLCALEMNKEDGSKIDKVIMDDMDSDDLDDFMDTYGTKSQEETGIYLYYFGDDADSDGSMKTGSVSVNLDGDSYNFLFKKTGAADSRGRGVNGVDDGKYIYKYGQKVKADSDDKYTLVYANGNINDSNVVVEDFDNADIKNIDGVKAFDLAAKEGSDEDNLRGYHGFGTAQDGWYLVNTSGRIQTGTKSGTKDGYDMYWFMYKDNIKFYADDKNISDYDELKGNGWHTYFDNAK